jgi:hypothetical protein
MNSTSPRIGDRICVSAPELVACGRYGTVIDVICSAHSQHIIEVRVQLDQNDPDISYTVFRLDDLQVALQEQIVGV